MHILDLTDPISVYLLGFIWADGHVKFREDKYSYLVTCSFLKTDACEIKHFFLERGFKCCEVLRGYGRPQLKFSLFGKEEVRKFKNLDFCEKSRVSQKNFQEALNL